MIILIIFSILPLSLAKKKINFTVSNSNGNNVACCSITPKNQQQCFESKYNPCCDINGSYKQCTNNFKHKIECQCDQNTLNLDICKKPTNEKCFYKNKIENKPFQLPNNKCPRVNMFNTDITNYDTLK